MSIKKTDVLGNLVYASVSMSCANEIPGYNGSLFAISDTTKERIESELTEARAAVAELIEADREYDAARAAYRAAHGRGLHNQLAAARIRFDEAVERRATALANVGSAP